MNPTDHIRQYLRGIKSNYMNGGNFIDKICAKTGLPRDEVIISLSVLRKSGEVECNDWYRGSPVSRVYLHLKIFEPPHLLAWLDTLDKVGLSEPERDVLGKIGDSLEGWESEDLEQLAKGLIQLRDDMPKLIGQPRYLVSARYLLGSSKLLDSLRMSALREFGIDKNLLQSSASYVIAAGPQDPQAVIMVENPQAMEAALSVCQDLPVAFVATFGYGLSMADNQFGNQLASIVDDAGPITTLVRSGRPPPVSELLQRDNIQFWGDLDLEGMRIYWRLKGKLPSLTLSGLYKPMLDLLRSGESHPYITMVGKAGQHRWRCLDDQVMLMVEYCQVRAVDQEALGSEEIRQFVGKPFSIYD